MSGTPVIMHRSCPNDWLAQFSQTNVHKGGLKQHSFHFPQEKNPLSLISEEDMIQLQSVLSTEEGKKILQQTSLPEMDQTSGILETDKSQEVAMETKSDDVAEPEPDIPLELDDETASQILKVQNHVYRKYIDQSAYFFLNILVRTLNDSYTFHGINNFLL
jgi:hypothetical protein